ncbi:MAG TPA: DUF72 domain-containing protein [Clostridiaceae bacterium]|nr:DUF72 domain-containing protein [Clostridiaceae bacterium]
MIYIGTSGYSYDDWIGCFYSKGISKGQMLPEYAKRFKFTEVNSTYYSIPNRFMFYNLAKKTPDDFKFTVKLHRSMTHSRNAGDDAYKAFNEALSPIIESNKLGCIVAQFPYSFHMSNENLDYIKTVKEHFKYIPICVEFRSEDWMKQEVYKQLSMEDIGFVCVDEPDIKGLVKKASVVTSKVGYVRFHGRNSEKWYNHKQSYERYNYLYTEDELKEWVPRIQRIDSNSDLTFVAFNNHFKGQGAENAMMLEELLK